MAEPEPNIRAVLAGVNWQELTKRLLLLTQEFVRDRYLPGKSPGDLVHWNLSFLGLKRLFHKLLVVTAQLLPRFVNRKLPVDGHTLRFSLFDQYQHLVL